jgi:putative ABC transport system permease protein
VTARSLVNIVTPGYAEALGLRLRAGRLLEDADVASGMQSLVVNEEFVRTFLAGVEPVGVNVGAILTEGVQAQVVGVVKNVLKDGLDVQPHPEVYVPPAHRYSIRREVYLLARTSGDPIALGGTLRQLVRDLRTDAALENVTPLASEVAASVASERFATAALGSFASLAMILAAVGLYGVLSYGVSRRERELAVRRALGASRGRIAWLVIGDGMSAVAAGLIVGLLAAAGAGRLMQSVLFGVEPLDIPSFALACGVLAAAALIACAVPARRAAATDPAVALRRE